MTQARHDKPIPLQPDRRVARAPTGPLRCLPVLACVALGLLLAAGGCVQPGDAGLSDSGAGVVDVMTFNIRNGRANDGVNNWRDRRDVLVGVISEYGGDIVGLQEAFDFQADYIDAKLPQYDIYYAGRDDGAKAGESCAILYRREKYTLADSGTFWFSDTPAKPSTHWGNKCLRICSWVRLVSKTGGKGIYVYNLHLDHISQYSRQKSTKLLARRISQRTEKDPIIVMGDFNMTIDNPGMKYLQSGGEDNPCPPLVSAWEAMHPKGPALKTGHGFKGGKAGSAIDHILIGEGSAVLKADVDQRKIAGRWPSDHYPVTARIKLY